MSDHQKILQAVKGKAQGLSFRAIAQKIGVSSSTIQGWLQKANALGYEYKDLKELSDKELADAFSRRGGGVRSSKYLPPWEELLVSNNTESLYHDYVCQYSSDREPLSRSAFYRELRKMRETLAPTLKPITIANSFAPGHIATIDYSGDGILIHDGEGKISKAQIFVGVLANSGLIFCLATPTQKRLDWLAAIAAMFHFYGGVTEELWLDNSTCLVLKEDKYAPKLSEELKHFCE